MPRAAKGGVIGQVGEAALPVHRHGPGRPSAPGMTRHSACWSRASGESNSPAAASISANASPAAHGKQCQAFPLMRRGMELGGGRPHHQEQVGVAQLSVRHVQPGRTDPREAAMPPSFAGPFRQATHRYRDPCRAPARNARRTRARGTARDPCPPRCGPARAAAQVERGSGCGAAAGAGVPEDEVIIRERERRVVRHGGRHAASASFIPRPASGPRWNSSSPWSRRA